MELRGLGYPALICKDMQASIDFYEKLGMRRLFMEPNRDDPDSVQVLMHAGAEDYLLLVGPNREGVNIAESSPGVGSMQYLTLHVSGEFIDQAYFRLSSVGLQASEEIRRGYERLVFLEDPNQILIALIAWTTEPPPGMSRAAVLARAGELKEEQGAPFLEDDHLRRAIALAQQLDGTPRRAGTLGRLPKGSPISIPRPSNPPTSRVSPLPLPERVRSLRSDHRTHQWDAQPCSVRTQRPRTQEQPGCRMAGCVRGTMRGACGWPSCPGRCADARQGGGLSQRGSRPR